MINLGAKSGQTSKWRLDEGGSRLELGYLADIDNGSRYPRGWWLWWWLRTHDVREVIFSGARYIWREWTAAPAMGPSISVIENIFKFANDNATLFRHNPFPRSIHETGEDFVLARNFLFWFHQVQSCCGIEEIFLNAWRKSRGVR